MKLRKETWDYGKLSELMSFKNGFNFNKGYLENGWKVIGVSDFQDYFYPNYKNLEILVSDKLPSSDYLIEDNDILFVRSNGNRDLVGRTILIKEPPFPITFSAFCIRGRFVNHKIDPLFFTFYSKSDLFKTAIKELVQGTNITNVSQGLLSQLRVPLPPLEEQKQIAALFQSIETAMEQVDGQERNLLQLKNKLLSDLFSDKKEFGNHLTAKDFETVRFDKIAINISERVEPKKTELTTYVGLEHLDADNLVIERTGTPDDVIGTKLKIYKGDIIFGKRRAYLRKVAVSHFDGIASAHSMVLRANEKHIEKDFLPFFMQSDAFMNRAVQISEGSLSPTIKVKTLAQQEFTLPKKEKQKELVILFKQFDQTRQQLKQQKATLKLLKGKLLNEILG